MKTELNCIAIPNDTITFNFDGVDLIELVINCKKGSGDEDYKELSVLVNINDLKRIVDSLIS
jgi:hypothetical protein